MVQKHKISVLLFHFVKPTYRETTNFFTILNLYVFSIFKILECLVVKIFQSILAHFMQIVLSFYSLFSEYSISHFVERIHLFYLKFSGFSQILKLSSSDIADKINGLTAVLRKQEHFFYRNGSKQWLLMMRVVLVDKVSWFYFSVSFRIFSFFFIVPSTVFHCIIPCFCTNLYNRIK